ncbi:hypothetical protein [Alkalihalobacterium alkalinitrilicum]|uniref:hypothetical protein n=1 Tax=Alkalihalobacterium alkalinitrilicum TaxID=427920 RepID=UPI000995CB5B|nr:hypothetical protein [Alkalihalobacterium alkalinitrilicum]
MRYIGIDPSTKTGLVILENSKVVVGKEITSKQKKDPDRFIEIAKKVIAELKEEDEICLEGFSYGSKGSAVSIQYGVGWIIRAMLTEKGFTYNEVAPTALKKYVTGKGNVKKDELVLPIYKRWDFEHKSDNVRDAFVLAQMCRALHEPIELTTFQKDALNKVTRSDKDVKTNS